MREARESSSFTLRIVEVRGGSCGPLWLPNFLGFSHFAEK